MGALDSAEGVVFVAGGVCEAVGLGGLRWRGALFGSLLGWRWGGGVLGLELSALKGALELVCILLEGFVFALECGGLLAQALDFELSALCLGAEDPAVSARPSRSVGSSIPGTATSQATPRSS